MVSKITTHELLKVRQMWRAGFTIKAIAERYGVHYNTARQWIIWLGEPPKDRHTRPCTEYTVYNDRDEVIAFGTAEICAGTLGISRRSFYRSVVRQAKGELKRTHIVKEGVPEPEYLGEEG